MTRRSGLSLPLAALRALALAWRAAVISVASAASVASLAAAGCDGEEAPRRGLVYVDGQNVVLEAPVALRGLQVDLEWEPGVTVAGISAGPDVERLDLFRVRLYGDGRSARLIVTDTRKVKLPLRGVVARLEASTADGSAGAAAKIRAVAALGADEDAAPVELEVR